MEARALCVTLSTAAVILLCARHRTVDAASLRVDPNRSQFFEYEPVTLHCEGVGHWDVVHKSRGTTEKKATTGSSCTIANMYPEDSGEYWCAAGGGRRSDSIFITVTAGPVILESPALPVTEGEAATLSCRIRTTSSKGPADFYKDGVFMGNSSTGETTIHRVSKSDGGLYKCNFSGAGESPESWLEVRGAQPPTANPGHKETDPTSSDRTPWIVVTVFLMALLAGVGLCRFGKEYWARVLLYMSSAVPDSGSGEHQTGSVEVSAADANKPTYAVVKARKKKASVPCAVAAAPQP